MNRFRERVAILVAFIYLVFLLAHDVQAQPVSLVISTDQPIYPIWGLGGSVRVTVQNPVPSATYYLWLQRPGQSVSNYTGISLAQPSGGPASVVLNIASREPPGTYFLSLSKSGAADTQEAGTHFGVLGTNSQLYERTETVTVAGGGFAPNSTISVAIAAINATLPGFPVNITAHGSGEFQYRFRLPPSSPTGSISSTVTGTTYDKRQPENVKTTFSVTPSTIIVKTLKGPPSNVERTLQVSATYGLTYQDGSPVTAANASASVILGGQAVYDAPLTLVNSTSGEWRASWTPTPSAAKATYHFQFTPANFTDAYGNVGNGTPLISSSFNVTTATLQATIHAASAFERTQNATFSISATYPSGTSVANVTQTTIVVTGVNGTKTNLSPTMNVPQPIASFKIPVNAAIGNWTVSYSLQDPWGNPGSGTFIFQVRPANLTFQPQIPYATQRTTFLNLNNTVYYPDGTTLNSTDVNSNVTLQVYGINQTWTPTLHFDSTTERWSGSIYIVQNATVGRYNITWSAFDAYGNAGTSNYSTFVVPAQFTFVVERNDTGAVATSNLDIPVLVRYPNGSSLSNSFGNVTGSYQNSTGYVFTLPLAYNATNATWHMYFFVPKQSNATLSFNATDLYGNSGLAMDAYNLKISPVPREVTQNLVIAAVLGSLIPIGLLIWAFLTISTRKRKHKP